MREVSRTIRGQATSDGDGVRLTRVIGGAPLPQLDPFLLFDEFGSERAQDYIGGFPNHPHRGFETVTYMLDGRMRHGDNQGNSGLLESGSVQWMTAGRGIVHSEMPEQQDGLMRGFQLWVNLPARDKMTAPRYQDIAPRDVPEVSPQPGVKVRVLAGRFGKVAAAVTGIATDPCYLDIHLDAGRQVEFDINADHNAFAYVYEGSARIGTAKTATQRGELTVLSKGERVVVSADAGAARLVFAAARPLGEPVARYGPFVMNTRAQISQAVADYQAGRF